MVRLAHDNIARKRNAIERRPLRRRMPVGAKRSSYWPIHSIGSPQITNASNPHAADLHSTPKLTIHITAHWGRDVVGTSAAGDKAPFHGLAASTPLTSEPNVRQLSGFLARPVSF
jgi:hypothetical protein